MPGRDMGYFQISHFDFPLNDSLVKTFGAEFIPIDFQVRTFTTYIGNPDDSLEDANVEYNTRYNFEVRRTSSAADIANNVSSLLFGDFVDRDQRYKWQEWFTSFYYDSSM